MFQTAYSEKVHPKTINNEPSMTKENLRDSCDVNKIIKRFKKTGVLPELNKLEGIYGDVTSMDLADAIKLVDDANNAFMQVPASIRKEFNNDAGAFIDFATNPQNLEQMRAWGLAMKDHEAEAAAAAAAKAAAEAPAPPAPPA